MSEADRRLTYQTYQMSHLPSDSPEVTMYATSLGADGAELCPLQPWQAEEFLAHVDRGREFIGRFNGLPDAVSDLAAARTFLTAYAEKEAADAGLIRGIRLDGTLVGAVILRRMDVPQGTAEAGCWLEPDAVGRGLVTRAARLLIDWAIRERGIHRVEWWVSAGNAPSIAVARRLGMHKEAVLRESYPHRGERHDEEIWAVLAWEWTGRAQAAGA
ncbi:N-acetyltransferase GCN5 [Streptomyces roseochromogenus subsp. oscitans DS 12.976]|uniref:N-acetyltransferase GCN5 n=2 Tax=Streptomyces roseochromogenus TaxID=285450 RepID=V6KW97_STRRC|nr:N-acetyltransferase GCN5 [Streptomyces roseochromogenus subsp. oscitans DS 12.976]